MHWYEASKISSPHRWIKPRHSPVAIRKITVHFLRNQMFPVQKIIKICNSSVRLYRPVIVFGQRKNRANRKHMQGNRKKKASFHILGSRNAFGVSGEGCDSWKRLHHLLLKIGLVSEKLCSTSAVKQWFWNLKQRINTFTAISTMRSWFAFEGETSLWGRKKKH